MAPKLEELISERSTVLTDAEKFAKLIEDGGILDAEQRKELRSKVERKRELDVAIAEAQGDTSALEEIKTAREKESEDRETRRANARAPLYGDNGQPGDDGVLTLGQRWTQSESYKAMRRQFPNGIPADTAFQSDAILVKDMRHWLGMFTKSERMQARVASKTSRATASLLQSTDASAGHLVNPLLLGLLEPGSIRELTVRDLVTVLPISTDSFEYVVETTREVGTAYNTGASWVPEASAITGTSGTKPGAQIGFRKETGTVKTVAEWIAATRRILSDAPFLAAYIDEFLTDDLALAVENMMVNGSGVGEELTGILQDADIQSWAAGSSQNVLDALRHAKAMVQVTGRTRRPISYVIHPFDAEQEDTLKANQGGGANTGAYYGGGPFGPVNAGSWRMTRVESEAVPEGTVLVGDFSRAVLFDREDTNISVGTVNDDFLRNIVRVLAEARFGFAVIRPKAFVKVTGF